MALQPLVYTLHIQLAPLEINPPVWRRIRVSGDCTLRKLHHFIQAAMGWHSCHLHEFNLGAERYMPLDAEFMDDGRVKDDRKFKIRRLLQDGDRLRYLYDFGDGWQHVIAVESSEPCDFTGSWCEVIDGARACPPENVGGVGGYAAFLEAIADPQSELGREALEWVGGEFDAEAFSRAAANAAVQRISNNFWG